MKSFTGFEYLLIDLANHFGLDKVPFEQRISWARDNMDNLESLTSQADNPNLYTAALMAIRKSQQGIPSGYLVGFDATCSGIQIMSTLTGCKKGAEATGLVDPNRRADAYTEVTERINKILHKQGMKVSVKRSDAKNALMTAFYGSQLEPKLVFGDETPELEAFYQASAEMAPGATELLGDLLASWDPAAFSHGWQLPDGHEVDVKVMAKGETRIDFDELGESVSFTVAYSNNEPMHQQPKNAANVVHSVDAYVVRSIQRRCNYDPAVVTKANGILKFVKTLRQKATSYEQVILKNDKINYYIDLYNKSAMPDAVILPFITVSNAVALSPQHIDELIEITETMLTHKPFAVLTVHDEFKCHPNYMNFLRAHYIDVFARMADSTMLDMILNKLYKTEDGVYEKLSDDLSSHIRGSSYALC